MQTSKTVDIIIPSFRLDEHYLLPLLQLSKPKEWLFNYYIIVDNPAVKVPETIQKLSEENKLTLFINPVNLGASASRNKGIDAGNGAWILFLDDDVVAQEDLLWQYTDAISRMPTEIGFIGLTDFPPAHNPFTRALVASHLTSIFKIAAQKERSIWGVTANMMYSRSSMQELRFSPIFPKSGGGEDLDLPLRICLRNNQEFKCLKEAKVAHPWWNNSQVHFKRFIRYGEGTAYLLFLHKNRTSYDFPNLCEAILILLAVSPLFFFFGFGSSWLYMLIAIPTIEYISFFLQANHKGIRSFKTVFYMALLKTSVDFGILKTILKENQHSLFMKRIQPGSTKSDNFRLNTWKILKITLFCILLVILCFPF